MLTVTRSGLAALLFAAAALPTAGLARDRQKLAEPIPIGGALTLPCCQCAGGTSTADLSTGTRPWTVASPGGAPGQATANAANQAWTTMLSPAQWISPVGNPQTVGTYTYQTQFDARNCVIGSAITVSGKFLADNTATLLIDGTKVVSSQGTANYGFLPGSLTPFSYTIPAGSSGGIHTITLSATNTSGPTGIVAQVTATRHCNANTEIGGRPPPVEHDYPMNPN
jgi:hypothetical protein